MLLAYQEYYIFQVSGIVFFTYYFVSLADALATILHHHILPCLTMIQVVDITSNLSISCFS